MAKKTINCDTCGEPINGQKHTAINENFENQHGIYQCTNCRFDSDYEDQDNGPTGHGDICMSDADPGL